MTAIAGQVAAVTGGARGIGRALAEALHAGGARVAIGDIDRDEAVATAAAIGSDVLAAHLDVTDADSIARFVELTERELGPIAIFVNNAGIMPIGPFTDEPDALARRAVEINVLGPLTGMKAVLPGMLARGGGHVVNVASIAGKAPVPGGITYAATKAAIVSLTESARVEYRSSGIAFTCVMPSFTSTELIAGTKGTKLIGTVTPEKVAAAIVRGIERDRKDVYVPAAVGAIAKTTPLIGRRLRDAINRTIGADRTFLDIDQSARAKYSSRIAAAEAEAARQDEPETKARS